MMFETFAAWAAFYGKVYNGDEAAREAVWNANVAWIKEHQSEIDFEIGANQFADLTLEEFAAQYLTLKPAGERSDAFLGTFTSDGSDVPAEIDWASKGAVSPVKNQGQCGSCWAFSTVGSMEGRHQLAKGGDVVQFSEQQLVDCDKNGDQGCNGGLMDTAFDYLQKMSAAGHCTEDSYGYTGKDGTCKESSCTIGVKKEDITGHKDVDGTEEALTAAVAEGPVSVAIQANSPFFQLYTGGVFSSNFCGATLDHGVLTVGYGTDGGKSYWKVKNSWGTTFGEAGYIRMKKDKAFPGQCGILKGPPSYPVIASSVTV